MKSFLIKEEIKDLSFDDFHDKFRLSIFSETNKMINRYGQLFQRNEVEQQFLIELWMAYKKYDITKGVQASTYVYHRFRNVKTVLFNKKVRNKDVNFFNQVSSLEVLSLGLDGDSDYTELGFSEDFSYNLNNYNTNPEEVVDRNDFYDIITSTINSESEHDLFMILGDVIEFPIALYAEKYGISRQASYNRLQKLKEKVRKVHEEAFQNWTIKKLKY